MSELDVTFDAQVDAAYIYLRTIEAGGVAYSCDVECPEAQAAFVLDFDTEDRLIGIEVLRATHRLPAQLIKGARRI